MSQTNDIASTLNIQKIMEMLPHRYPFLLIDRIIECVPNVHILAWKNVTINEPFFQGHFPGMPIMPGMLILEAMAQTCGILGIASQKDMAGKIFLFRGVDNAKFRKQVLPGDRLEIRCDELRIKLGVCKMTATAEVDGKIACEAKLSAVIANRT
ncbi:MAG: 3-hydroxyacyl-ACP dehydratase FabZ [Desulfovibrio sp.]|nr:3-hydroxyacyl-ACP dehydratase FabZ [Desulfovibrio sp.]